MRLLKTIPGIMIMLLVLLPALYCAYFQAEQQITRHRMKEKLESDELQTVVVPVKDFRWYEENREIVVNGLMFDVESITRHGDNYVITGLFDEYETELNIALGKLQRRQDGHQAGIIYSMLSQLLIEHCPAVSLHALADTRLPQQFPAFDEDLYHTPMVLNTPPPRA